MGRVYEVELSHGQQAVLLAMADHGDDDGSKVFPSVNKIAWKTGYKRRHVQRMIGELRESGVLVEVAPPTRRLPTEYRVDVHAGTAKSPYVADDTRGDIYDTEGCPPGPPGVSPSTPKPSEEPSEETPVEGIFNFWVETFGKSQHKLTRKRRDAVKARLAEGFTPREICEAVKGVTYSPHHMGTLPDSTRPYDDLELICRSPEKVEGFRDLYQAKSKAKAERIDTNAEAERIRREQGLGE